MAMIIKDLYKKILKKFWSRTFRSGAKMEVWSKPRRCFLPQFLPGFAASSKMWEGKRYIYALNVHKLNIDINKVDISISQIHREMASYYHPYQHLTSTTTLTPASTWLPWARRTRIWCWPSTPSWCRTPGTLRETLAGSRWRSTTMVQLWREVAMCKVWSWRKMLATTTTRIPWIQNRLRRIPQSQTKWSLIAVAMTQVALWPSARLR